MKLRMSNISLDSHPTYNIIIVTDFLSWQQQQCHVMRLKYCMVQNTQQVTSVECKIVTLVLGNICIFILTWRHYDILQADIIKVD
jgi:hypothetical protein